MPITVHHNVHTTTSRRRQKGLTLIELMVATVIVGVLLFLAVPAVIGAINSARATALYDAHNKMAVNWQLATQSCGTSKAVTSSLTTAGTAGAALDLLFRGTGLAAAHTACYANSGVRIMSDVATGSAGAYTINNYSVSLAGGSSNADPFRTTFAAVPTDVALPLYNKHSSVAGANIATTFPTAADITDPTIQFTAPDANNLVSITLRRPI